MTGTRLIIRNLCHFRRTHFGVLLGVTVSSTMLVGALVIGDSIEQTLKTHALWRLGKVQLALDSNNRYFRERLADELGEELNSLTAPVVRVSGTVNTSDGSRNANHVQVLGVDHRFWQLSHAPLDSSDYPRDGLLINRRLAIQLNVVAGDTVVIRVEKPSRLPRDALLTSVEDITIALRLDVKAIIDDDKFGRFNLQANQVPPYNAFLPMPFLQEHIGLREKANLLLLGDESGKELTAELANSVLRQKWALADAGIDVIDLSDENLLELRSERIFIDPAITRRAVNSSPGVIGILTYFVNEIRFGSKSTPYSFISAIDTGDPGRDAGSGVRRESVLPSGLQKDEVVVTSWLAEDLGVHVTDLIEVSYYIMGPARKLEERQATLKIREVIPHEAVTRGSRLAPDIPGLTDASNCRDWEPVIPIELGKIRQKDELYWERYRGTPKAFINLKTGQDLWRNRFGELTAARYSKEQYSRDSVAENITRNVDPAALGLSFSPVGEDALLASSQAIDFGYLFMGFSVFIIIAALLLTGLLFVLGIEQRTEEIGTLLALGFTEVRIRRLFLFEGIILAILGGLPGMGLGLVYTKCILHGLSTIWYDATGVSSLVYHAEISSILNGALAGSATTIFAITVPLRNLVRQPVRNLLSGGNVSFSPKPLNYKRHRGSLIAVITGVGAVVLLTLMGNVDSRTHAALFFTTGTLLLIGAMGLCMDLLQALAGGKAGGKLSIWTLGIGNLSRHPWRSLTGVGLLACGCYLIVAVGANRHDSLQGSSNRASGTGGFVFWGESTHPIYKDLNSENERESLGLDKNLSQEFKVVSFRVCEGDDASCRNLNRAQHPRLLGVKPDELAERNAFTFASGATDSSHLSPWLLLKENLSDNSVPGIADQTTVVWGLGKKLGDTVSYVDENGQPFNVRIIGIIANSVLQGNLLIDEEVFINRYPSESGYKRFLIDLPANRMHEILDSFTRTLQDVGLSLTPTHVRLAEFNAIENTYLSIFQTLGGLGLMLGTIGLGVVLLRNVVERRSELALLRAVGFTPRLLLWLIISEHWLLLVLGILCGGMPGIIAVFPVLNSPGMVFPYFSLTVTIIGIFVSGIIWTLLAAVSALRGPVLMSLREE